MRFGRRRLDGGPLILMYHRVAVERSDPWGLCVSPAHFAEHLDVLGRFARTLPLDELHRQIVQGTAPRDAASITFDDGYVDNLLAAHPALERAGLPATVFIATGYTGSAREFWWDELDRILLEPGELPATLDYSAGGAPHRLDLGRDAHYSPSAAARHATWRAYATEPPTQRHAAFLSTWELLVTLRDAEQWEALESLRRAAGVTASDRVARRALDADQLRALARSGLVQTGAHTVTHPALPLFPPSEQGDEIRESGAALEALFGAPVASFSYPHGRFSGDTAQLVRDAGFRFACAATPGPHGATGDVDPFALGRVMVPDCDGDAFRRLLDTVTRAE